MDAPPSGNDPALTDKAAAQRRPLLSSKCPFLPYSLHNLVTFVSIETVVVIGLILYVTLIHPTHTYLTPLAVLLPSAITAALHNTLTSTTLPRYDRQLRASLCTPRKQPCDARTDGAGVPAQGFHPPDHDTDGTPAPDENNAHKHRLLPHNSTVPAYPPCDKCARPRLQRTHHCRKCARCIPRMSHHCGVLGVCIGVHNLKPFLLLCFYGSLSTGLVAALTVPYAATKIALVFRDPRTFSFATFCTVEAVYLMFVTSAGLALLLAYHVTLVARNFTVLDTVANRGVWSLGIPCMTPRVVSPFHAGSVRANVRQVFGSGWFALVPVADIPTAVAASTADGAPMEWELSQRYVTSV